MTRSTLCAGPADYTSVEVELTFDEAVSLSCVDISIEDDDFIEEPESFNVTLTSGDSDVTFMPPAAPVFIVDDDSVTIGFETELYTTAEGDGSLELCAVLLEGALERDVTVTLETQDGSAQGTSQVPLQ